MQNKNLLSLDYAPSKTDIIYHYCPDKAFWAICQSKSLWLSSIYEMNDSKELVWPREIFTNVLKMHKNQFAQKFRIPSILSVFSVDKYVLPLIVSFSKNGDLLSQWRAYADDGKGFAIGVDAFSAVKHLGVRVKKVLYNEKRQRAMILQSLIEVHEYWKSNNEIWSDEIDFIINQFSIDLAAMKNPGFFEEQEIRMMRLVIRDNDEWIDPGGHDSSGKPIDSYPVCTRNRGSSKIHYISLPLSIPQDGLIREIVIGPKNTSSIQDIKQLICKIGLSQVRVEKSTTSYR